MINPMSVLQNVTANSPIGKFMNMVKAGNNPQALMNQMVQQNPQLKQALPLIQGKSPQQLETVFSNLCKQCGTTPEEVLRQFGMNPPNGGSNT